MSDTEQKQAGTIDHTALCYAVVRDATFLNDNVPPMVAIAVLELVKNELITRTQGAISAMASALQTVEPSTPANIALED